MSGLFDNSTYPIGPVTTLYGRLDITYKEGANASGTVVSYPAVEIRPTTTHRFDVKTLEVILHYDPVYYVPADIVFGYVHFRIAPVTPPTISITFPGEDTTIVVTDEYLPTIVLKETHTPADAVVTWTPSNSIAAADHITPLVSEATVTVNATATRECGGEQTVARKITFRKNNVNKSPLITKINYTPNRRYFAYNDIVTVTAEATDPDGDAVSIKYEPEQEFILNQIGEFIVKITAIDSKGATTVKEDKIYAVGVTITPSKGIVKDGDNIDFQVDIYPKSISASSFEWSWEPENPNGGNNPFVNFIPDNAHQSVIVSNAKWYADPDRECPPCSQTSSYNLGAILYIGGDKFETKGKMGVFLPVPGGKTIHDLRIVGEPDFVPVFDKKGNILRYKVDGISKMKRIDNPTVKIFVSGNSRFYDKVLAHENVHKEELLTGVGKDIASLDKLYKKIKNLTANSFIEIRREYFSILNEFILNEIN
ncbi:MAG: hypothetical protein AB1728_08225 [Bacteroidota bacterium]